MKRKELTKTFLVVSNLKKTLVAKFYTKLLRGHIHISTCNIYHIVVRSIPSLLV